MKRRDDGFRLFANRILDPEEPRETPADRQVENRLSFARETFGRLVSDFDRNAFVLFDEVARAQHHALPFDGGGDPVGHHVVDLCVVRFDRVGETLRFRGVHDGAPDGMREVFFEAGGKTKEIVRVVRLVQGDDVRQLRRARRERSRLVKDHRVDFGKGFQVLAALHDDAPLRTRAHGGENRQRRRETQGATKVDHENGRHAREVPRDEPDEPRQKEVIGNDAVRPLEGFAFDPGLRGFGILDEAHDLLQTRAVAHARGSDHEFAVFKDRARKDGAALHAVDGQGFARHRGLIDAAIAVHNDPVHGNGVSGMHHDDVFLRDIAKRDLDVPVSPAHPNAVDTQGELVGKARHRLLSRIGFEHFAQTEKNDQKARRAEIPTQKRDEKRRAIQHRHVKAPAKERLHAREHEGNARQKRVRSVESHRKKRAQEEKARKRRKVQRPIFSLGFLGGERESARSGTTRCGAAATGNAPEKVFRKTLPDVQDRHVGERAVDGRDRPRKSRGRRGAARSVRRFRLRGRHLSKRPAGGLRVDAGDEGRLFKRRKVAGDALARVPVRHRHDDRSRTGIDAKAGDARRLFEFVGEKLRRSEAHRPAGAPTGAVADFVNQFEDHEGPLRSDFPIGFREKEDMRPLFSSSDSAGEKRVSGRGFRRTPTNMENAYPAT